MILYPSMSPEPEKSLVELIQKYNHNPETQRTLRELSPIVEKFKNKPPYTGESLELFVKTATDNPETGWLFLHLLLNYWPILKKNNAPDLTAGELELFINIIKANVNAAGINDSIELLLDTLSSGLFSLSYDIEKDGCKEGKCKCSEKTPNGHWWEERVKSSSDILRRIAQPLQHDSITGSIQLGEEMLINHLDPDF